MRIEPTIDRIAQTIVANSDYIWDPEHKKRKSDLPAGYKWYETPKGWTVNPYEALGHMPHNDLGYDLAQKRQIERMNIQVSPEMKTLDSEYSKAAKINDIATAKSIVSKYSYLAEKSIPKSTWIKDLSGKPTEILKNPTRGEIKELSDLGARNKEVGFVISVSGNTYGFRRDNNLHHEVAKNLGLREFTTVNLGQGYAEVTPTVSPSLKWTDENKSMIEYAFPYIPENKISGGQSNRKYNPIINNRGYIPSLFTRFYGG